MPSGSTGAPIAVTLRLPGGDCYRVEASAADLAGPLAPGRKAPREFGMASVAVEVRHAGGQYLVPVSAGELTRLLSRGERQAEVPLEQAVPSHRPS
jgi:hypothetical protein